MYIRSISIKKILFLNIFLILLIFIVLIFQKMGFITFFKYGNIDISKKDDFNRFKLYRYSILIEKEYKLYSFSNSTGIYSKQEIILYNDESRIKFKGFKIPVGLSDDKIAKSFMTENYIQSQMKGVNIKRIFIKRESEKKYVLYIGEGYAVLQENDNNNLDPRIIMEIIK